MFVRFNLWIYSTQNQKALSLRYIARSFLYLWQASARARRVKKEIATMAHGVVDVENRIIKHRGVQINARFIVIFARAPSLRLPSGRSVLLLAAGCCV